MRSFVLGAIALLATAAVASAGVTMGIGQAPGSMGGAVVLDQVADLPSTLTLYMNFVVDANSPSGARSVEGRVAVDAPGVAELVTDFVWGTYGTYSWSAYANTYINGGTGYMNTHYNDESVDGVFGAGKMWDTAFWLDMNNVEGPIASVVAGCPGVATAGRIGGAAGATARAKGGPGGVFLPADPMMTLAILTITIPADAPAGNYTIGVCDAYYADVASGGAMDIAPGDGVSLQIVPEPTAALLLIGALPFLRRRR